MTKSSSTAVAAWLVGVIVWIAPAGMAENWPSFRGPNGSGIGTGTPPVSWNVDTGENVRWKVPIPGLAHSSPIVWGNRVFLTTAVPAEGEATAQTGWLRGTGESAKDSGDWEWRVLCLDKQTGKTLWERTAHKGVPNSRRHIKATHADCTPATDGEHVVAFFGSEGLYVYDMEGKLLWKKDLGPLHNGPARMPAYQWGFASSPIIHDGKIILQCDVQNSSFWAAFDISTGSEVIRVDRGDDPTWTTPTVVADRSGKSLLVCNGYKKMAAYELWSGKLRWHLGGGGDVPVPRPVAAGDKVVLTNAHGPMRPIYVISADASGDVTPTGDKAPDGIVWWQKKRGSYMPTPIVIENALLVADDNGALTSFALATGEQIYRARLPGGRRSTYSASPVCAGSRIYVTNESGQVDVIAAGSEYEVLGSNRMNEVCMATPAISDGLLLIRGTKHLFCIGLSTANPDPSR